MIDVVGFLESLEKLAYKILLWVILVPKTLWKIVTDPKWVPDYIHGELFEPQEPNESKQAKVLFDEYVSPMVLLFLVALTPAIILILLNTNDISISNSLMEGSTVTRDITFTAEAAFIPMSSNMRDRYTWRVELISTDGAGSINYDTIGNPITWEIYKEIYNEYNNQTRMTTLGSQYEYSGEVNTHLTRDHNSSDDEFHFAFERAGKYFVNVNVARADTNRNDVVLDEHETRVLVDVPINPEQPVSIKNYDEPETTGKIENLFTSETAIILALFLMTPPLFFAWVIKLWSGYPLSETSLKSSFYTQCYYFSPLSLAFWVTIYGVDFYTLDIFSFYNKHYRITLLLPFLLALCWFICAQAQAVAYERKLNISQSLGVVIGLILIFGLIIKMISNFWSSTSLDEIRRWMVGVSPMVFYLTLLSLLLYRFYGWFIWRKKFIASDLVVLISFIGATLIFLGGSLVAMQAGPITSTPTQVDSFISLASLAMNTEVPATPIPVFTAIPPTNTHPAVPSVSPVFSTIYYLNKGEFPYCIARRFNIHPKQLLSLNGFVEGQVIPVGAPLFLPEDGAPFPGNRSLRNHPTTIVVKSSNETIYSISCQFGDVDPNAIAQANGITVSASLAVGQQLYIP